MDPETALSFTLVEVKALSNLIEQASYKGSGAALLAVTLKAKLNAAQALLESQVKAQPVEAVEG